LTFSHHAFEPVELLGRGRSYFTRFKSGPVGRVGSGLNGRNVLAIGFRDMLPGVGATYDVPSVVNLDEYVVRSGPLNFIYDLPDRSPLPRPLSGVIARPDSLVRIAGSGNGVVHVIILSLPRSRYQK